MVTTQAEIPPATVIGFSLHRELVLARDNARRAAGDPMAPIAAVYAIVHRTSVRRYIEARPTCGGAGATTWHLSEEDVT
jgi:hypothetical protein